MHPVLLHLGPVSLPTFGVLAAVGLMFGLGLSERTARLAGISPDALWDAGLFAVIAAFVLSRGLLVMAYPRSFQAYPAMLLAVPSLTAAALLLTGLATLGWLRWKRIPVGGALEAWAPCATLVWGFLAVGHFAEGSDPGLATGLPWGVRVPGEAMALHPVALYVGGLAWGLTGFLYGRVGKGDAAGWALAGAGLGQFLLSFLRQPGVAVFGMDQVEWVGLAMFAGGAGWLVLAATGRSLAADHPLPGEGYG